MSKKLFVNHCSRLSCVHVHETTSAEDAITDKRAFEQRARERGVTTKHHHADNGIFKSAAFLKEVTKHQQTIPFCGVDAHHQNGIAEHRIRVLSDTEKDVCVNTSCLFKTLLSCSRYRNFSSMNSDPRTEFSEFDHRMTSHG